MFECLCCAGTVKTMLRKARFLFSSGIVGIELVNMGGFHPVEG